MRLIIYPWDERHTTPPERWVLFKMQDQNGWKQWGGEEQQLQTKEKDLYIGKATSKHWYN